MFVTPTVVGRLPIVHSKLVELVVGILADQKKLVVVNCCHK